MESSPGHDWHRLKKHVRFLQTMKLALKGHSFGGHYGYFVFFPSSGAWENGGWGPRQGGSA